MLAKAAAIGSESEKQTNGAVKQYQKLDKDFESNKKEEKIFKNCVKSNLVYSKDFTFCKHRNTKELAKRSFYSKRNDLIEFKDM